LRQGAVILVLPPPLCKKCGQQVWTRKEEDDFASFFAPFRGKNMQTIKAA
jgi:hypothetical protein